MKSSEYDPVFVDAVSSAALSLYFGMHREDKPRQTKTGGKDQRVLSTLCLQSRQI